MKKSLKSLLEKKFDKNGNRVILVRDTATNKSFTVQTNHNLPFTHRLEFSSAGWDEVLQVLNEVKIFVTKYGTLRQQTIIEAILLRK